ncbi:putative integrase [Sulfolobus acidocaldarius]|uniref:putative integrase n=1 Tax=Sulfolobus acidocaldarius TaxID=2285 RepID=UPI000B5AAA41|nr:putative integrase [Sulfolobus acidocaldarius]
MPNFYISSKFYIKEIKGKYYVYNIEKGQDGKERHNYIGPLEKIIETYMGVLGGNLITLKCRGRDLNPGHGLERLDNVSVKR